MTENELKDLRLADLLEMLVESERKVEELKKENERLQAQLDEKKLAISEAGSIAEASLKLSGIFEAAQKAADQYLYNLQGQRGQADDYEAAAKAKAVEIVEKASKYSSEVDDYAAKLKAYAEQEAARIITKSQEYSEAVIRQADEYKEKTYQYCAAVIEQAKSQTGA